MKKKLHTSTAVRKDAADFPRSAKCTPDGTNSFPTFFNVKDARRVFGIFRLEAPVRVVTCLIFHILHYLIG
jgi:hypothetical protein